MLLSQAMDAHRGSTCAMIELWTTSYSHPPDPWIFYSAGNSRVSLRFWGLVLVGGCPPLLDGKRIDIGDRRAIH